jgi:citrate lyase alpha subunit
VVLMAGPLPPRPLHINQTAWPPTVRSDRLGSAQAEGGGQTGFTGRPSPLIVQHKVANAGA